MIGITTKKSFIGIIIWIISITNRPESAHTTTPPRPCQSRQSAEVYAKPFTTYRRQPAHLASKIGGFVCHYLVKKIINIFVK